MSLIGSGFAANFPLQYSIFYQLISFLQEVNILRKNIARFSTVRCYKTKMLPDRR